MKEVRRGDYILHNSGGRISAISVVKEDCKSGSQPRELKTANSIYEWDDDGWIVYTKYYDFDNPVLTSNLREWAKENYTKDSAFQTDGKLLLRYLCNLSITHAEYIIQMAIRLQEDEEVIRVLHAAFSSLNPTPKTDEELAEEMGLGELERTAAERSKKK